MVSQIETIVIQNRSDTEQEGRTEMRPSCLSVLCLYKKRRKPFPNKPLLKGGGDLLDDALREHRVGDLREAGDVGAHHVVTLVAVLLGGGPGVVVDRLPRRSS